jgi:hypothetical protein
MFDTALCYDIMFTNKKQFAKSVYMPKFVSAYIGEQQANMETSKVKQQTL